MNARYMECLGCPRHPDAGLLVASSRVDGEDVRQALLRCKECDAAYQLEDGIPDFLPEAIRHGWADRQPGPRPWTPGRVARLLSAGNTRLRRLEQASLAGAVSADVGCGEQAAGTLNLDVYRPENPPANFILASAESLPLKSGSVEVVWSSYVIEHLLNPGEFVRELIRVSRKRVILVTDNIQWIGDAFLRVLGEGRIYHDEHCYGWSVEYMRNFLTRALRSSGVPGAHSETATRDRDGGHEAEFAGDPRLGSPVRRAWRVEVEAVTLSDSLPVRVVSLLGALPRVGPVFHRDLFCRIELEQQGSTRQRSDRRDRRPDRER